MRSIVIPALLAGLLSSFYVAPAYAQASAAAPESAQATSNDPPPSAESTGAPETTTPPPASPTPATDAAPAASPTAAPGAPAPCCTLVDGTFLDLEIAEPLSSKTAQRGQRFKLRLAKPASVDGVVVLPAGLEGVGEVVHAERARGAGKAGELILAARYIVGPQGEIRLRGFKLGTRGSGESRTTAAFWIPLGFLVRGGEVEIPAGAGAHAKLAGAQTLKPAPAPVTLSSETSTATASGTNPPDATHDQEAESGGSASGKDSPNH